MSKHPAQITHAECQNIVKAAVQNGLSIAKIVFENGKLEIVLNSGDSGEKSQQDVDAGKVVKLLREPQI